MEDAVNGNANGKCDTEHNDETTFDYDSNDCLIILNVPESDQMGLDQSGEGNFGIFSSKWKFEEIDFLIYLIASI